MGAATVTLACRLDRACWPHALEAGLHSATVGHSACALGCKLEVAARVVLDSEGGGWGGWAQCMSFCACVGLLSSAPRWRWAAGQSLQACKLLCRFEQVMLLMSQQWGVGRLSTSRGCR